MTRRRGFLVIAAVAVAVAATALAIWRPWSTPLSGITLEVRGEGSVSMRQELGEGGTSSAGKNKLEIRGGRLIANGKDGGPLKSGDSVLLDMEGRLFVNGQERTLNVSRRTSRCSSRSRHHAFAWFEVEPAGPAAELGRSAAWFSMLRCLPERSLPMLSHRVLVASCLVVAALTANPASAQPREAEGRPAGDEVRAAAEGDVLHGLGRRRRARPRRRRSRRTSRSPSTR